MNEKAQKRFNTIEQELVLLNNTIKNEGAKNNLRLALQHLGEAYNLAGGR